MVKGHEDSQVNELYGGDVRTLEEHLWWDGPPR